MRLNNLSQIRRETYHQRVKEKAVIIVEDFWIEKMRSRDVIRSMGRKRLKAVNLAVGWWSEPH